MPAEAEGITKRPKAKIVWDNRIELPAGPSRRDPGQHVRGRPILTDPAAGRRNWTANHALRRRDPLPADPSRSQDRCPTSTWQQGDYIIDRVNVVSGGAGHPLGKYDLWIGFFTGTAPNFKNMTVSAGTGRYEGHDDSREDQVCFSSIDLRRRERAMTAEWPKATAKESGKHRQHRRRGSPARASRARRSRGGLR